MPDAADALLRRVAGVDPLRWGRDLATPAQLAALDDPAPIVIIDGGNRAGKSRTATLYITEQSVAQRRINCWYATTTYELASQSAWPHLRRWLFWPGESPHRLPSRRVSSIQWLRPGIPKTIILANYSTITIKSYDQGPGEFQAAQLDIAVIDEEAPQSIWAELQARFLSARQPKIIVAATPVLGVYWLAKLREQAEERKGGVSHHRLRTLDNPARNDAAINDLIARHKDDPDEIALRLEGRPYARTGLVYGDKRYRAEHRVEPFHLDPGRWSFFRFVDPGWRACACIWVAADRRGDLVVYRTYIGRERTISENVKAIKGLSQGQSEDWIFQNFMDPYACEAKQTESGKRVITLYAEAGLSCLPARRGNIMAGIELVWRYLSERGGVQGEVPRLRFFAGCCDEWERERRLYSWREAKEDGDEGAERPEDRENHVADCVRYACVQALRYLPPPAPPAPAVGTMARLFWDDLHPEPEERL